LGQCSGMTPERRVSVGRTVKHEPPLIAAGRASEVFDLGDGGVLRRFKNGGRPDREAMVMRHARLQGFPVPDVLEIRPDGLVLEKIEGPTLRDLTTQQPSEVAAHAALLARLHRSLHEIDAPEDLPLAGQGRRLLHLDLHPANVIVSSAGPVVVDWTNARRGASAFDVAVTWVIGATSTGQGRLGSSFLHQFLSHFDRSEVLHVLPAAAEYRAGRPKRHPRGARSDSEAGRRPARLTGTSALAWASVPE
jgi:tRNA A-37 threonylcarbamoyl transferase component Bud32